MVVAESPAINGKFFTSLYFNAEAFAKISLFRLS
jgi:hypothetical protein